MANEKIVSISDTASWIFLDRVEGSTDNVFSYRVFGQPTSWRVALSICGNVLPSFPATVDDFGNLVASK